LLFFLLAFVMTLQVNRRRNYANQAGKLESMKIRSVSPSGAQRACCMASSSP
jgi:hypothetical protein